MTETTHCLVSHPKFFCNVLSSAHRPQCVSRLLNKVGNFKLCTCIGSLSVIFLCVLQTVWQAASSKKRNPVAMSILHQQSLFCGSCMSSLYSIKSNSPEEQYLAQMARLAILEANSITCFFDVHLPFFCRWCYQEQLCLTVKKNHFKCHILQVF